MSPPVEARIHAATILRLVASNEDALSAYRELSHIQIERAALFDAADFLAHSYLQPRTSVARLAEEVKQSFADLAAIVVAQRDTPKAITVWRFADAPKEIQAMSDHGGDEDWVAYCPVGPDGSVVVPMWASEGSAFGWAAVSQHLLADGSMVLIGAHS